MDAAVIPVGCRAPLKIHDLNMDGGFIRKHGFIYACTQQVELWKDFSTRGSGQIKPPL